MAEFLTTYGISSRIEDLMLHAKTELYLVSPFLQISKTFFERIKDASESGVKIAIVYGKDELKQNERTLLSKISSLELFYFDNLHAKCYFNEKKMVITSMNMYEFSEKNNREMGVLIDACNDQQLFEAAKKETLSLIKSAKKIKLSNSTNLTNHRATLNFNPNTKTYLGIQERGFCLRCSVEIPFNPSRPYCSDCFRSWAYWANPLFTEKACHCCGESFDSSMDSPLCSRCYSLDF